MNSKIFIVVGILHLLKVKILDHLLPKLTTELMKTLKRSPKNPYIMTSMNLIILKLQKKQFSLMHLNISSLQYHFEELNDLLETSKTKFSVIGITESRLKKGITPISNINLQNYKIEHTPTESEKGGSLL